MGDSATVTRGVSSVDPAKSATAAWATTDARGALVMADRVGEKVAARAALEVDGVIEYKTAIGSVLGGAGPIGGAYPSARVDMSESAPVVTMVIALSWPCAVGQVCRDVREHVAQELARLTGIRPSRVDVTVAQIITDSAETPRRSDGYIDVPSGVDEPTEQGAV